MMGEMDFEPKIYNPFYVMEEQDGEGDEIDHEFNFDVDLYPDEQEGESEENEADGDIDSEKLQQLEKGMQAEDAMPEREGAQVVHNLNNKRTIRTLESNHPILHRNLMGAAGSMEHR